MRLTKADRNVIIATLHDAVTTKEKAYAEQDIADLDDVRVLVREIDQIQAVIGKMTDDPADV